ncbi:hypothetical protein E2C01_005081 [Portunus trituberculatus]|uniref:Uncharacterized protein n=1 Tax=Portunus trituberculatus TaxID=210409 RepID=A0A5B7CU18_PORTR|nr:hypothetical protein [Portunus trituberculatus]
MCLTEKGEDGVISEASYSQQTLARSCPSLPASLPAVLPLLPNAAAGPSRPPRPALAPAQTPPVSRPAALRDPGWASINGNMNGVIPHDYHIVTFTCNDGHSNNLPPSHHLGTPATTPRLGRTAMHPHMTDSTARPSPATATHLPRGACGPGESNLANDPSLRCCSARASLRGGAHTRSSQDDTTLSHARATRPAHSTASTPPPLSHNTYETTNNLMCLTKR